MGGRHPGAGTVELMDRITLSLLRGVCQMPAYMAYEEGYFREQGIDVDLVVEATASLVPERMLRGDAQFGVIPWTRTVAASALGEPLVLVCGSGCDEAAIVVRRGITMGDVRRVAVPQRGGIKDLTAVGLMHSLGWDEVVTIRLPSGDGAILALVGEAADAACMVEPYATMLERLGIGTVVRRTGDLWPGAPGCSLTTTADVIDRRPELVQRIVTAFIRGMRFIDLAPDRSAEIASGYIGIGPAIIRAALEHNRPDVYALYHEDAMNSVIMFMQQTGYITDLPARPYKDLRFFEHALAGPLEGPNEPIQWGRPGREIRENLSL
jgi:NitT/TauT family transport system substrate-binding protein